MGTRSKTNVLDKNGKVIISIYRQNDGGFDQEHGKNLVQFFTKNKLAKKIGKTIAIVCPEFNGGMEDLAGKLFCFLCTKTKEIMPAHPDANDDFEYEYEIGWIKGHGLYVNGRYGGLSNWDPIVETYQLRGEKAPFDKTAK